MKSKFVFTVISVLLILTLDFIYYFFRWFSNDSSFSDVIYIFVFSLILLILLLNLGYKKLYDIKKTPRKFVGFFLIFLLISVFISQKVLVINKLYFFTKNYRQNEKGSLWQQDEFLSYKGIPNKIGTQDYYIDDSIKGGVKTLFDSIGFRTVETENRLNFDTLNLFLGCSFTFGSFIKGEETYSYLLSKKLNNNYINAGGSGYGAGQMLIFLDTLLKKYKFKYVFLQLSPWLTDRAMQINAPFYYFYRPIPYFSDNHESFQLNYPAYNNTSITFKYNWNSTKPNYFEKFKFIFSDGFKIEVIDYSIQKIAKLKIDLKLQPKPTNKRNELEKYIYKYAIDRCKQNGAIPVILKLAYSDSSVNQIKGFLEPQCVFIDLDEDLLAKVKQTDSTYSNLFSIYHIYHGKKIIFDTHPNALANEIMANKIYKVLNKNKYKY